VTALVSVQNDGNWDDSSKTHYLLAADPEHAYALARILKDCHDELNDIEKDDDE
jgi:hypothetical protein